MERKQGEEKLKESEERYRGLVEYSTECLMKKKEGKADERRQCQDSDC